MPKFKELEVEVLIRNKLFRCIVSSGKEDKSLRSHFPSTPTSNLFEYHLIVVSVIGGI